MADNENRGFSNRQFTEWREKLNKEIRRRGTFTWWDPLMLPTVGSDREPRHILPLRKGDTGLPNEGQVVSNESYVIQNPSDGAIEKTRSRMFYSQGDNPGGQDTDGNYKDPNNMDPGNDNPKTSAARFDQDEIRNYLIGLAKIHDVDLFHGRSERAGVAFRDPKDIGNKIEAATKDILHEPWIKGKDPDEGQKFENFSEGIDRDQMKDALVPVEETIDGETVEVYKMPSRQYDGEEILPGHDGPDPTNFYDDYGAKVENVNVNKLAQGNNPNKGPENGQVLAVHDSYQDPDFKATVTTNATKTPGGERPKDGFIVNPDDEESFIMETLPGFEFKQSQSGGADAMEYDNDHPNDKDEYSGHIDPLTGMNEIEANHDKGLAYHPQNPFVSAKSTVQQVDHDNYRNETVIEVIEGGKNSERFGLNPRNPQRGSEYSQSSYRTVFSGKRGLCHVACTGLCYLTCDSECNESCTSTCWNRCGDACVSNCANVCTGCESLCYDSCDTRCENEGGFSCINVGAKAFKVETFGKNKEEWPKNVVKYQTHSCDGCSYSCQFYPNYRTSCTDALCQNMCFYSCYSYCSTACYGGCIDNKSDHDHSTLKDPGEGYADASPKKKISKAKGDTKKGQKIELEDSIIGSPIDSSKTNMTRYTASDRIHGGIGQACKEECVADCVGSCILTCVGTCENGCFTSCTNRCWSNCESVCTTECGKTCKTACHKECGDSACGGKCDNGCSKECYDDCNDTCDEVCADSENGATTFSVRSYENEGDEDG